ARMAGAVEVSEIDERERRLVLAQIACKQRRRGARAVRAVFEMDTARRRFGGIEFFVAKKRNAGTVMGGQDFEDRGGFHLRTAFRIRWDVNDAVLVRKGRGENAGEVDLGHGWRRRLRLPRRGAFGDERA